MMFVVVKNLFANFLKKISDSVKSAIYPLRARKLLAVKWPILPIHSPDGYTILQSFRTNP